MLVIAETAPSALVIINSDTCWAIPIGKIVMIKMFPSKTWVKDNTYILEIWGTAYTALYTASAKTPDRLMMLLSQLGLKWVEDECSK